MDIFDAFNFLLLVIGVNFMSVGLWGMMFQHEKKELEKKRRNKVLEADEITIIKKK